MKNSRLVRTLGWPGILLFVLGIVYFGLVLVTGTLSPFVVVRGESMEPTFHSGDLLVMKRVPAGSVGVGDIVSFHVPSDFQNRTKIPPVAVHRVIAIKGVGGALLFVTKGDNSDTDPFTVPVENIQGRLLFNLGPVGRPLLLVGDNPSVLLYLSFPLVIFILVFYLGLSGSGGQSTSEVQAMRASLSGLSEAVTEYGIHLKSHTAVVKSLAGTCERLEQATQQQNRVLADLTEVVQEMRKREVEATSNTNQREAEGHVH